MISDIGDRLDKLKMSSLSIRHRLDCVASQNRQLLSQKRAEDNKFKSAVLVGGQSKASCSKTKELMVRKDLSQGSLDKYLVLQAKDKGKRPSTIVEIAFEESRETKKGINSTMQTKDILDKDEKPKRNHAAVFQKHAKFAAAMLSQLSKSESGQFAIGSQKDSIALSKPDIRNEDSRHKEHAKLNHAKTSNKMQFIKLNTELKKAGYSGIKTWHCRGDSLNSNHGKSIHENSINMSISVTNTQHRSSPYLHNHKDSFDSSSFVKHRHLLKTSTNTIAPVTRGRTGTKSTMMADCLHDTHDPLPSKCMARAVMTDGDVGQSRWLRTPSSHANIKKCYWFKKPSAK